MDANQIIFNTSKPIEFFQRKSTITEQILVALSEKTNFEQILETILVGLRNLIPYDRAGLFLLDDERRYLLAESSGLTSEQVSRSSLNENLVAVELNRSSHPIIVSDVDADKRFEKWFDLGPVRSWMGVPIKSGDEMVGFLSLGSLEIDFYNADHGDILEAFVEILSPIILKSWPDRVPSDVSQNLEVISNIAFALGQAVDRENILSTVIDQIPPIFQSDSSSFLIPDPSGKMLTVISSTNLLLLGTQHLKVEDPLWQAFDSGKSEIVINKSTILDEYPDPIYEGLFNGMVSGVIIPIRHLHKNYGILCIAYEKQRHFSYTDKSLFNAVSQIAGNFFHQAIVFEKLDEEIKQRSQQLSSLYKINTIISETNELATAFKQILSIILEIVDSRSGYIQIYKEKDLSIENSIELEFPIDLKRILDTDIVQGNLIDHLETRHKIFECSKDTNSNKISKKLQSYLKRVDLNLWCTAIKAKNELLGTLYFLNSSRKKISREQSTLLLTIATQLGYFVERTRLIKRGEQAAVIEERQRLARELHDSISQLLYSQILFAGAGINVLNNGNQFLANHHLERIEKTAQQALKEMRLLIYELRPYEQLEGGFVKGIQNRLNTVENRTGITATLTAPDQILIDEVTQGVFYFIALEALNNTLKHAQASNVEIIIYQNGEKTTMEISDNGIGFDLETALNSGGMGIKNMQDYADSISASLRISSKPLEGTRILLKLT